MYVCVCVCVCVPVGLEAPTRKPKFLVVYYISPKTDTLSQKLFLPTFLGLYQSFLTSALGSGVYLIIGLLHSCVKLCVCVCVCVCVCLQ